MKILIEKSTFEFLKRLKRNNNREWFQKNKDLYVEAHANVAAWVDLLIHKMNQHDMIQTVSGKESLYRIYNDVRFSEDKTPYNPRFFGYLKRQKPLLRGGYYYWIKPGESRVGCGFAYPHPDILKRVREDIDFNYDDWYKLLSNKKLKNNFGEMQGDQVKTAPRGFPKDHPAIKLLRYKQYWFEHSFTDDEVLAADFVDKVNTTFKAIRPFFNYMTEILSTDKNGEVV
ncbi:TIGR02453 family protein [Cytophagales bacterium WSM2-2]|nr:TIGR02453 family protein [Cytophagales bacterium WSM2-2]